MNSSHGFSEGSEDTLSKLKRTTESLKKQNEDISTIGKLKTELKRKYEEIQQLKEGNQAVLNSSTFERFLDISEQNAKLKQALKNMLILLNEHCNIDQILELKDREKLAEARNMIK